MLSVKNLLLAGLLVAFVLPGDVWARQNRISATEAGKCLNCSMPANNPMRLKDNAGLVATSLESINSNLKFAGECRKFADDGRLGVWAQNIRSIYAKTNLENLDEGTPDIHRYCPTYGLMKENDKANFWVLVLNAMAHFENSCKIRNTHPAQGPNGTLVGILQLHANSESDYVPRGADCRDGDGRTAEGSFRCALLMLDNQLRRQGALFSRSSYWDVLRPQAKSRRVPVIIKAITRYAPCHDETKLQALQFANLDSDKEILTALENMETFDNSYDRAWTVQDYNRVRNSENDR